MNHFKFGSTKALGKIINEECCGTCMNKEEALKQVQKADNAIDYLATLEQKWSNLMFQATGKTTPEEVADFIKELTFQNQMR